MKKFFSVLILGTSLLLSAGPARATECDDIYDEVAYLLYFRGPMCVYSDSELTGLIPRYEYIYDCIELEYTIQKWFQLYIDCRW